MQRAGEIRDRAGDVTADPIDDMYYRAFDYQMMRANTAMPGYGRARDNIGRQQANTIGAARRAGTGSDALAAIAFSHGATTNAYANLDMQNAAYQDRQKDALRQEMYNIGRQRDIQENIKRMRQEQMLARAAQLESDSTANRDVGSDTIAGSFGMAGGLLAQASAIPADQGTYNYFDFGEDEDGGGSGGGIGKVNIKDRFKIR